MSSYHLQVVSMDGLDFDGEVQKLLLRQTKPTSPTTTALMFLQNLSATQALLCLL